MADFNDKVWPPPPGSQPGSPGAGQGEAKICPNCGRKLLTQTSALCNWCGAKIDDPEYQMRAAMERQSLDKSERERVVESQQTEPNSKIGRLISKIRKT